MAATAASDAPYPKAPFRRDDGVMVVPSLAVVVGGAPYEAPMAEDSPDWALHVPATDVRAPLGGLRVPGCGVGDGACNGWRGPGC
jgi:hypothetical protein